MSIYQASGDTPDRATTVFGVLRLIIAVIFIGLLVWALTMMGRERTPDAEGYAWIYFIFGGLVLLIGLPSLVIGLGLLYRQSWAYHAAIWYDFASVLVLCFWISQSPAWEHMLPALFFIVIPLAEVSFLPRLIGASRPTRVLLPILLVVAGSVAFMNPVIGRNQAYQQVRPVVDYARTHWVDLPGVKNVRTSDLDGDNVSVFLSASDSRSAVITVARAGGAWRVPTRDVAGQSRPVLSYGDSSLERNVGSAEAALAVLRDAGVKNNDLVYVGTVTRDYGLQYRFCSASAGGSYYVSSVGTRFDLFLEGPDVVIGGG